MHEHTPVKIQNRLLRFLYLLVSPKKVFRYYMDGADVCEICYANLELPYSYYSPVTKVIYALAGAAGGILAVKVGVLEWLIPLVLGVVFHHIASAAIFAFCPWDVFDLNVRSGARYAEDARKELERKILWFGIAAVNGAVFAAMMLL